MRLEATTTTFKTPYPIAPPIKYGGKSPHTNVDPNSAAPNLVFLNAANGSGFQSCIISRPQVTKTTIVQMRKIHLGFGNNVYARKMKNNT